MRVREARGLWGGDGGTDSGAADGIPHHTRQSPKLNFSLHKCASAECLVARAQTSFPLQPHFAMSGAQLF